MGCRPVAVVIMHAHKYNNNNNIYLLKVRKL